MRLYIRRVMDGSAEMLDRLNAELAREDNQIVETEQSADNLAEVLDDLTAELKGYQAAAYPRHYEAPGERGNAGRSL